MEKKPPCATNIRDFLTSGSSRQMEFLLLSNFTTKTDDEKASWADLLLRFLKAVVTLSTVSFRQTLEYKRSEKKAKEIESKDKENQSREGDKKSARKTSDELALEILDVKFAKTLYNKLKDWEEKKMLSQLSNLNSLPSIADAEQEKDSSLHKQSKEGTEGKNPPLVKEPGVRAEKMPSFNMADFLTAGGSRQMEFLLLTNYSSMTASNRVSWGDLLCRFLRTVVTLSRVALMQAVESKKKRGNTKTTENEAGVGGKENEKKSDYEEENLKPEEKDEKMKSDSEEENLKCKGKEDKMKSHTEENQKSDSEHLKELAPEDLDMLAIESLSRTLREWEERKMSLCISSGGTLSDSNSSVKDSSIKSRKEKVKSKLQKDMNSTPEDDMKPLDDAKMTVKIKEEPLESSALNKKVGNINNEPLETKIESLEIKSEPLEIKSESLETKSKPLEAVESKLYERAKKELLEMATKSTKTERVKIEEPPEDNSLLKCTSDSQPDEGQSPRQDIISSESLEKKGHGKTDTSVITTKNKILDRPKSDDKNDNKECCQSTRSGDSSSQLTATKVKKPSSSFTSSETYSSSRSPIILSECLNQLSFSSSNMYSSPSIFNNIVIPSNVPSIPQLSYIEPISTRTYQPTYSSPVKPSYDPKPSPQPTISTRDSSGKSVYVREHYREGHYVSGHYRGDTWVDGYYRRGHNVSAHYRSKK